MKLFKHFKDYYITIQRSLTQHMIMLILLASGAIFLATYFFGSKLAITHYSESYIDSALNQTEEELNDLFYSVKKNLLVGRQWAEEGMLSPTVPETINKLFIPMLKENTNISSVIFADLKGIECLLLRSDKSLSTEA